MPGLFSRNLLSLLMASAATTVLAQHDGYRALEDFADPLQEARQVLVFEARAGDSLRATMQGWAKKAGWNEPDWRLAEEVDFALGSTIRFEGDYKTATRSFIGALGNEASLQVNFDEPKRRALVSARKR